jgi:hypothetical protein
MVDFMSKGDRRIAKLLRKGCISQDDVDALKNRDLYDFVSGNKHVLRMLSEGTIDLTERSLSYIEDLEYKHYAPVSECEEESTFLEEKEVKRLIEKYLNLEALEDNPNPITRWLNQGDVSTFCENSDFIREALEFFEAKLEQANLKESKCSKPLLEETQNVKDALIKLDEEYPIEVADVRNIEIILQWLRNPNEDNNEDYDYGNDPDDPSDHDDPNGFGCSSEVTNSTNTNTTGVEDLGMTNSTITSDPADEVGGAGFSSPYQDLTSNPV